MKHVKCEICSVYFSFVRNTFPYACLECRLSEKFLIPILILERLYDKRNINCMSKYEQATLFESNLCDYIHNDGGFARRVKRKLIQIFT